jgi:hypothetical protein
MPVQAVGAVHETPNRVGLVAPTGLGVDVIVQFAPSQLSASGVIAGLTGSPTAIHAVDEVQETAKRT